MLRSLVKISRPSTKPKKKTAIRCIKTCDVYIMNVENYFKIWAGSGFRHKEGRDGGINKKK